MDDKYRFEDFGLYVEEGHEHPMTPVFEEKTIAIPDRPGLWDFGSEIREKHFSIPLAIIKDRPGMQQKLNSFVAFLSDELGKPRTFKIVFDYEPDKHYWVKYNGVLSPSRFTTLAQFLLPLVAYDPYKFSNVYADEVTWGSTNITFEADYLLGHTNDFGGGSVNVIQPQTVNITVSGLAVQPIFEINGTANNLTLSANGHSFSLPNFSNTKWIIDFEKYVVFRNGQDTMIEIRDFYLTKGNNEIKVTGSNLNIDLAIKYRDKYN